MENRCQMKQFVKKLIRFHSRVLSLLQKDFHIFYVSQSGHDTTSCAIAFCLFNLAKHSEVQQKSYEEVLNILGDVDREITMNDLNELNYLELVIKESLRLFPPVPVIGRKLFEEVTLSKSIQQKVKKKYNSTEL